MQSTAKLRSRVGDIKYLINAKCNYKYHISIAFRLLEMFGKLYGFEIWSFQRFPNIWKGTERWQFFAVYSVKVSAMVHPIREYATSVWDSYQQIDIQAIEKV